jgi:hypothetical protein
MPDWVKLGEFSNTAPSAQPAALKPQPPVQQQQATPVQQPQQTVMSSLPVQLQQKPAPQIQQPYSSVSPQPGTYYPGLQTIQAVKKVFRSPVSLSSLKGLFYTWLVSMVIYTFTTLALSLGHFNSLEVSSLAVGLSCAQSVFVLLESVLMFILIYHFWKAIQDGYARTSAGKAVGFLFIPVFFYYWIFVVFYGLSQDLNAFIKRHFSAPTDEDIHRSSQILAFIFSFSVLANLIVSIITISQTASNMMAPYTGAAISDNSLFVTLFTLAYNVLTIVTFIDFYETESSILTGLADRRRPG